jgi:hypothetical protein
MKAPKLTAGTQLYLAVLVGRNASHVVMHSRAHRDGLLGHVNTSKDRSSFRDTRQAFVQNLHAHKLDHNALACFFFMHMLESLSYKRTFSLYNLLWTQIFENKRHTLYFSKRRLAQAERV